MQNLRKTLAVGWIAFEILDWVVLPAAAGVYYLWNF